MISPVVSEQYVVQPSSSTGRSGDVTIVAVHQHVCINAPSHTTHLNQQLSSCWWRMQPLAPLATADLVTFGSCRQCSSFTPASVLSLPSVRLVHLHSSPPIVISHKSTRDEVADWGFTSSAGYAACCAILAAPDCNYIASTY